MTDIEARAERVRAVVEANFGRVIGRDGDAMTVEIPADVAPGMPWGLGGFVPVYQSTRAGQQERRVTSGVGPWIVCPGDFVTMNFHVFEIDLRPPEARRGAPPMATANVGPSGAAR
jgi:hypothetical protein